MSDSKWVEWDSKTAGQFLKQMQTEGIPHFYGVSIVDAQGNDLVEPKPLDNTDTANPPQSDLTKGSSKT